MSLANLQEAQERLKEINLKNGVLHSYEKSFLLNLNRFFLLANKKFFIQYKPREEKI